MPTLRRRTSITFVSTMIWLIVQGRQLPADYARICCKSVAVVISALWLKKTAKHNCLEVNMLQQWTGVELDRAHTEIWSECAVCKKLWINGLQLLFSELHTFTFVIADNPPSLWPHTVCYCPARKVLVWSVGYTGLDPFDCRGNQTVVVKAVLRRRHRGR